MKVHELLHERYEIIRQIGKGGTSQVFQVLDHRLSLSLAMKRIAKAAAGYQKEIFAYEIKMMAQLQHRSIPRIYDCFEDAQYAYVVMELVEGMSLLQFVRDSESLKQSQVLDWMEQLCLVFRYLHSREPMPMLYLDLKPQNIMMDKKGRLFLIDFGSSCWIDDIKVRSATPGYAPQELLQRHSPCFQSDIYSFGRTFYVLYHGHFPNEKEACDNLDKILLTCCEEDIEKRYRNFEQVRKAIVGLRLHSSNHRLYLGVSLLLCLLFLGLGVYCYCTIVQTHEQTYLAYMRQGRYKEALEWKNDELEPYQKLYESSCDVHTPKSCELALRQVEELVVQYHQEQNSALAFFLGMNYMTQGERFDYAHAQQYLKRINFKSESSQELVEQLLALTILLQKMELTDLDSKNLEVHLEKIVKDSEQIVDKQEVFRYQTLCLLLYDSYHKEIEESEIKLIQISEGLLAFMRTHPESFTLDQRMQVLTYQGRGYYYQGLLCYEAQAYEKMVEAYDKAIIVMQKTSSSNSYSWLVDMELACFEYGVKDEEKGFHLERLEEAMSYAQKIERQEERSYYQARIEVEMESWREG